MVGYCLTGQQLNFLHSLIKKKNLKSHVLGYLHGEAYVKENPAFLMPESYRSNLTDFVKWP